MADARLGLRLAGLGREQLEEFVLKAAKELTRGSEAAIWLNAALATASPVPDWAVRDVLVDVDLCAAIISHLDVSDHSAASVCHAWHREWRAMLMHRKVMKESAFRLECNDMPDSIIKLPDYLLVCQDAEDRLVMYTEDGPVKAFAPPWPERIHGGRGANGLVLGEDGCVFHFNRDHLKLRRLRRSLTDGELEEDVVVQVRRLTANEELTADEVMFQQQLILREDTLYLFRDRLMEAFDANTLAPLPERGFLLLEDQMELPFEKFDASEVLSYVSSFDGVMRAVNRSGEIVALAPECNTTFPFAFDVCDGRLYVLDSTSDDELDENSASLLSLTLDGRPTQSPLKLEIGSQGYELWDITHNLHLSASPSGIYISDRVQKQVRRIVFAGQD